MSLLRTVWVGRFPNAVTEAELRNFFRDSVVEAISRPNAPNGRMAPFAFVELSTSADARRAVDELHGTFIRHLRVSVRFHNSNPAGLTREGLSDAIDQLINEEMPPVPQIGGDVASRQPPQPLVRLPVPVSEHRHYDPWRPEGRFRAGDVDPSFGRLTPPAMEDVEMEDVEMEDVEMEDVEG